MTLETALSYITNKDIDRARALTEELNVPELTALFKKYERAGVFDKIPAETIAQWAQTTRRRYLRMRPPEEENIRLERAAQTPIFYDRGVNAGRSP